MKQACQPSLMDSLKEAIRERHAHMEEIPFTTALVRGELPLESYVALLRAMAVIQGTLEHELSLATAVEIKAVWQGRPSRLAHLRRDLSVFDAFIVSDIPEALEHARKMSESIRRYRVEQPTDLLGILYVLEGTTLGNASHLPDILKNFGSQTAGTAYYYAGYGDRTNEYWEKFRFAMNALSFDQQERDHLIQVANTFFDQLKPLFASFYPIHTTKSGITASMLNPEAGDHAVPGDIKEIEAAVTAARKCREEFPYFDERYQERGRSFAKSDAAWLVTLTELPQVQVMSQVEWFGRVLANRGIPRITLERQLELLYQELTAAVPVNSERYGGLLEAASSLKAERLRLIPAATFNQLVRQFHSASDDEMQGRQKGTGTLIVSAVADEAGGISNAVTSLLTWFTNAEQFSAKWITAVRHTEEQARLALVP